MKRWIAGTLAAALLVAAIAAGVAAQAERTASVEVRVWQSARDDLALYVSARPAGGSWRALGTIPLDMSGLSQSGRYRYGDIAIDVPLPDAPTPTPTATPTATPTPTPSPTPTPAVCERPEDGGGLPPAIFTGTARIDGQLAERGTAIMATVGDACCASATVGANGEYTLQVPSGCGSPVDTIAFTVDGLTAAETGVWSNLGLNQLDLGASR